MFDPQFRKFWLSVDDYATPPGSCRKPPFARYPETGEGQVRFLARSPQARKSLPAWYSEKLGKLKEFAYFVERVQRAVRRHARTVLASTSRRFSVNRVSRPLNDEVKGARFRRCAFVS